MSDKCQHYWNYVHAIYDGDRVRRWCGKCKVGEIGIISTWRAEKEGEFENAAEHDSGELDSQRDGG